MPFAFDIGALLGGASDAFSAYKEGGRKAELDAANAVADAQRAQILAEQLRLSQSRESRQDPEAQLEHQRRLNDMFVERERQRVQNEVDIRGGSGGRAGDSASVEEGHRIRNKAAADRAAQDAADALVRSIVIDGQRRGIPAGSQTEANWVATEGVRQGLSHEQAQATYDRLFGRRDRPDAGPDFSSIPVPGQ